MKGDRFNLNQSPKNKKRNKMKNIPYTSVVGNIMYVQVCIRSNIAFAVNMLRICQSDQGMDHWRAAKKVFRYL